MVPLVLLAGSHGSHGSTGSTGSHGSHGSTRSTVQISSCTSHYTFHFTVFWHYCSSITFFALYKNSCMNIMDYQIIMKNTVLWHNSL